MRRALLAAALGASLALGLAAHGEEPPTTTAHVDSNGIIDLTPAVASSNDGFNMTVYSDYARRFPFSFPFPHGNAPVASHTPSLLLATPHGTPVDLHVDPLYEEAIRKGEDLILNREYDEAKTYFADFSSAHTDSALGPLGTMLVWQSMMLESSDFQHEDEYLKAAKEAGKRIGRVKKPGPWDHILESGWYGVKAMHAMRGKHYFAAVDDGWDALSTLKKLHAAEPGLADTGVGLGNYDYWRSVVTENSKWIPFFKDKRKEGLAELEHAFVDAQYTRPIAQLCLVYIYIEEHRNPDAIALAEDMARRYPHNTLVRVQLGRAYSRMGRYRDAIRVNQEVVTLQPDNKVAVYFIGANYCYEGRDLDKADEYLTKFVKDPPANDWRGWGNERLGDVAFRRGDIDKAIELWKKALKDNSDDESVKFKIAHAHDKKSAPVPQSSRMVIQQPPGPKKK